MGGYLLDLGAACSDYVANSVFNLGIDYNTPLCQSRPACSSASDGLHPRLPRLFRLPPAARTASVSAWTRRKNAGTPDGTRRATASAGFQ